MIQNEYLSLCNDHYPYIYPVIHKNFLSRSDCQTIIDLALKNGFNESEIDYNQKNELRKSLTCWLSPNKYDIIKEIYIKVANLVDIAIENFEPLQVVYYKKSNFFSEHFDQCLASKDSCKKELLVYNNKPRVYTLLIYLNNLDEFETVSVINLQGRVVVTQEIGPYLNQIPVESLAPGLYFVRLAHKDRELKLKVIKN